MEHIVIIGNGISGISAARHIRKLSDKRITVISSETDYFFSRTALMYVYMGHMKFDHTKPYENHFWIKNKIDLKRGFVTKIDGSKKEFGIRQKHLSLYRRKANDHRGALRPTDTSKSLFCCVPDPCHCCSWLE